MNVSDLNPDQQLAAAALRVIVSVSEANMRRRPAPGAMHFVNAEALHELADAINVLYPGAIRDVRRSMK